MNPHYWITYHQGSNTYGTTRGSRNEAITVYENYKEFAPRPCIVKIALTYPDGTRKLIARCSR